MSLDTLNLAALIVWKLMLSFFLAKVIFSLAKKVDQPSEPLTAQDAVAGSVMATLIAAWLWWPK